MLPMEFTLINEDDVALPVPGFITSDGITQVDVVTTDSTLHGDYLTRVKLTVGNSVNTDFVFKVRIICTITSLTPLAVLDQTYRLTNDPLNVSIGFTAVPACGVPSLLINTDKDATFETNKGFISIQDPSTLVIQSQDLTLIGQRTVTVQATVETSDTVVGMVDDTVQFFVDMICVVTPTVPTELPQTTVNFG